jgi:hypothetical protein
MIVSRTLTGETTRKSKAPQNPNPLADSAMDHTVADPAEEIIIPHKPAPPFELSPYIAAITRKGSQTGAKRRRKTVTDGEHSSVAAKVAKARRKKGSR